MRRGLGLVEIADRVAETVEWLRPIRRTEYDRMVACDLFESEKLELLHGCLVEISPQDSRQAGTIQRLTRLLVPALSGRAEVRVQLPLSLLDDSVPEPDVALVRPGDYDDAHPSEAFLVVEVAQTSLRKDRGVKASVCAEANVPEYWVVNLVDRRIEVHTEPAAAIYARVTPYRSGEAIRLTCFPEVEIAVADILR